MREVQNPKTETHKSSLDEELHNSKSGTHNPHLCGKMFTAGFGTNQLTALIMVAGLHRAVPSASLDERCYDGKIYKI
jgi:hypothetical protein